VPAVYAVFARRTKSPQYVSRLIAKLRRAHAEPEHDRAHEHEEYTPASARSETTAAPDTEPA